MPNQRLHQIAAKKAAPGEAKRYVVYAPSYIN
jgi:hypothetical protein